MKKTINVTQEHIDKGKPGKCSLCPVALALKDSDVPFEIAVDIRSLDLLDDVPTPYNVAVFIDAFDSDGNVAPFSFEIEL